MRYKMRCPFAAIEKVVIRLTPLPDKLEFDGFAELTIDN